MAIRKKRVDGKTYLETDTIADWVEALSMGLPIKAPPALAEHFRLPDNPDDFETPEEIMATVDRRRAQQGNRRASSPARTVGLPG